jgi:flagellar biosynthesis GTPase FlhF
VTNPIGDDDYYAKSREFRAWLATSGKKPFGELSGEQARAHFSTFCGLWNAGGLPAEYYVGRVDDDLAESGRTSFKWSFTANIGESERMAMLSTRDTVHVETDKAGALVADIEAGKAVMERKKKRREHWERKEAERKTQERAEYEAAVASTAKKTQAAAAAAETASAVRSAVSAAGKAANPTPEELMAQLGLKPGQKVVMKPQPGDTS